jgi:hypothetical protein
MVQQPAVPFAQPPARGGRKPALIGVGAVLLAAGVGGGLVMMSASSTNYDDGVANLARAPIGCTTTLQFDQTGTFTVYVETTGQIGHLRGDCPNTENDYHFRGDGLPNVDVELLNDAGDTMDMNDDTSKSYDAAGFIGASMSSVVIDAAGTYTISVASDDDNFAIAIGKDPRGDSEALRTKGLLVIIAGVVLGGLLLVLGLRRGAAGPQAPVAAPGAYQPAPFQPVQPAYTPPAQQFPPTQQMPPAQQFPATQQMPPAMPPAPPAGGPQWPAPPGH